MSTICRAYVAAGRPGKLTRLASFQAWSDTVRSALVWLGKGIPWSPSTRRTPRTRNGSAWRRSTESGRRVARSARAVTLKEVIEACEKRTIVRDGTPPEFAFDHPDLRSAVHGALRSTRQLDAAALGYWMRARKNRIVDGMWFEQSHTREGTKWWVERRAAPTLSPPARSRSKGGGDPCDACDTWFGPNSPNWQMTFYPPPLNRHLPVRSSPP